MVSHYEDSDTNVDLKYSCPPVGDSKRTGVTPSVELAPTSTELQCNLKKRQSVWSVWVCLF